ncbi:MAG: prolyl aminopeptidase [Methylococcaceae bacterium]
MKILYPELETFRTHELARDGHRIYLEEVGNPNGYPVVILHGGPGSGCQAYHRRFFNPEQYHAILFDQRGSCRSMPQGGVELNTTEHLLDDMECIRQLLGLDKWVLFGGSWGSTLSLLYAERYPERVSGLILRGTFLARDCDMEWFFGAELREMYPEIWNHCFSGYPQSSVEELVHALATDLFSEDSNLVSNASLGFHTWGSQVILGSKFDLNLYALNHCMSEIISESRIGVHYAINRYFIRENQILDECHKLPQVPIFIFHGEQDLTCLVESSRLLADAVPGSRLTVLKNAGHTSCSYPMVDALVNATDTLLECLS